MSLGVTTRKLAPESNIQGAISLAHQAGSRSSSLFAPLTVPMETTLGAVALSRSSNAPSNGGLGSKI
eukprot:12463100-Alexandrium_andersonii.AAC.1